MSEVVRFVCVDDTRQFRIRVLEVARDVMRGKEIIPIFLEDLEKLSVYVDDADASENFQSPDFMIVDVAMAESDDGLLALKKIRGSRTLKHCPVIIHSQYLDDETISQSYIFSANSVVEKPPLIKDQRDTISEILKFWSDLNVPAAEVS